MLSSKNVACQAWFQNKTDSSLYSLNDEVQKSAPLTVKSPKWNLGKILDINWIPITGKPPNYSGKPFVVFMANKTRTSRSTTSNPWPSGSFCVAQFKVLLLRMHNINDNLSLFWWSCIWRFQCSVPQCHSIASELDTDMSTEHGCRGIEDF